MGLKKSRACGRTKQAPVAVFAVAYCMGLLGLAVCEFLELPVLQAWIFLGMSVAGPLMMAIGVYRHKPQAAGAWGALTVSQAAFAAGNLVMQVPQPILGYLTSVPLGSFFYLVMYALMLFGLGALIKARSRRWDFAVTVDVTLVATSAALMTWVYLLTPIVAMPQTASGERAALLVYPIIDLILLTFALRLILGYGEDRPAYYLILFSIALQIAGDTGFVVNRIAGKVEAPFWVVGAYAFALGAAALSTLHPSIGAVEKTELRGAQPNVSLGRIAVLSAAALVAPVVLAVQHFRNDLSMALVIAVSSAVMFLLVLLRMFGLAKVQQHLATTDALTGLRSRRYLDNALHQSVAVGRRKGSELGICIIDVDHFKLVNDTWGHDAGDEVLQEVAARLAANVRRHDVVARFGGEEFVAILPGYPVDRIHEVAERFRAAVAAIPVDTRIGAIEVTASVGVACLLPSDVTPDTLIRRADQALYSAKSSGRNRVVIAESDFAAVPY